MGQSLYRNNEGKIRSPGGALIQSDGCPYTKGDLDTDRYGGKTQRDEHHPHTKDGGCRRSLISDLGFQDVRNEMSVV